jgi:hypothetical protein
MPATFTVQSINPVNGMRKVLLSLIHRGHPSYVQVDAAPEVLAMIFGSEVREGDLREISAPLVGGTNGTGPSPLSQKFGG